MNFHTDYFCHQTPNLRIELPGERVAVVRVFLSGDAPDEPLRRWSKGLRSVAGGKCVIVDSIRGTRSVPRSAKAWKETDAAVRALLGAVEALTFG